MIITGTRVRGGKYYGGTASAVTTDTYFNLVSLLLPGNGTNGQTNNTFLDSSTNAFTITRNGNTTQGTFSPFSQTGWGNFFNGSSRLDVATSAAFATGTGSFTVEAWVYILSGTTSGDGYLTSWTNNTGNGFTLGGYVSGGNYLMTFAIGTGASANITLSSAITLNTWHHVAGVRNGSTMTLYIDGVAVSTTSTSRSIDRTVCSIGSIYGADVGGGYYLNGYVSNIRFVSSAVYTSNFTPSTSPLTAIANTQLLTAQSNRFVDNSGNSRAITVGTGSPSVQAFSPFDPTTAYAAATVGGSGYFDGTGDYLSLPSAQSFAGDFTLETWIYPTRFADSSGSSIIFCSISPNNQTDIKPTGATSYYNGSTSTSSAGGVIVLNTWQHYAICRSGSTTRIFVNGVVVATNASDSGTRTFTYIGQFPDGNNYHFQGYMSNVRWSTTAQYTATFTPPTSPVTGGALLLNYTNAGITDAAAKNVLETAADAQISTAQSKFGGSSIAFDGTGDYLMIPNSQNFVFGSGDFTIEFWLRLNANNVRQMIAYYGNVAGTNVPFVIELNTSFKLRFLTQTSGGQLLVDSSATPSTNTWIHVAGVRNGTSAYLFVDGVSQGTITPGTNALVAETNPLLLGLLWGGSHPLNGYIDDFRVTKGYARYTANFTPPTQAFPTQ